MGETRGIGLPNTPNGHGIPESTIFGASRAMQLARETVERAAVVSVPVLILGESGTGKEIIAREIHRRSPWSEGQFVKVSCPAIPGTLVESELFGYEKGAFTGAWNAKPGRVEMAHRGSLFLDEIGEMDITLQAKLLQLLQDGQFCRIGARQDTVVEVRIVCASNRNLEEDIETGEFRQDLFYRINVVSIMLPPLRDRKEDIPHLVEYFLEYYNRQHKRQTPPFSREVLRTLLAHDWPGNIRELENLVRRYVILESADELMGQILSQRPKQRAFDGFENGTLPLKEYTRRAVDELERDLILKVLQENHWNRKKSAQVLQISYRALLYKIKKAGLPAKNSNHAVAMGD